MIRTFIRNDIHQNKLLSVVTTVFMAISAMLIALTAGLLIHLLGAIDHLMVQAQTPDFLQMHMGEIDREEVRRFAEAHTEVREWQICGFLNLENGTVSLGGHSLANSTQDNGLCIQNEDFDYLLDMEDQLPLVIQGEVYVPVCYRALYDLHIGDTMQIGDDELEIAGFIRDSQMNSMMSSSKRFLVSEADYENIKGQGEEEYLIEFLLQEGADAGAFGTAYASEGLPANGPTITGGLIRMMNALSDGMMILVIFLASIIVVLISMLCIRFILSLSMEKDKKEVGMLKALGIGEKEIRQLYFAKYILLSVCGAIVGLLLSYLLKEPLIKQMKELYGGAENGWQSGIVSIPAVLLTEGMILLFIRHCLKKTERLSALEALFSKQKEKKNVRQYLLIGFVTAACAFLMLVPQNLYSTLSSSEFVTYMGIGNGEIRIDVRQTENINQTTEQVVKKLESDPRVGQHTVLQTKNYPAYLADGRMYNLNVEVGNHTVFPVSYVKGTAPVTETELALSSLNAKELGLSVGDHLQLLIGSEKRTYTICGIYSDITNGGKTAKAGGAAMQDETPVMWSILYVSLNPSVQSEQWLAEYNGDGVKAVDIADYVMQTYGQTLQEIRLASGVATGAAVVIIFAVVTLFMRLIVEKNRYAVSLQKALGLTNASIQKEYMKEGLLSAAAGVMAGLLIGGILGEDLCGIIIRSFGADGFRFVIAWRNVLFFIPAILLLAAGASVRIGISEIQNVKAFECCTRKE